MLTKNEKQEEINYQIDLIKNENNSDLTINNKKHKGHLSLIERDKITILYAQNYSLRSIAKILKRSPSTISRELRRKEAIFFRNKYIGSQTHKKVKEKWIKTHNKPKLSNPKIRKYVIRCLKTRITPELIAGRLRTKYGFKIYHETIYRFIYDTNNKLQLTKYLLRRNFGRVPRNIRSHNKRKYIGTGKNIPNRIDIDFRETEANLRLEFGHFEADSVEGTRKRMKQDNRNNNARYVKQRKSCLTVIVDRTTRLTRIIKTASLNSIQTSQSILKAMKPYLLNNTIKSITYDNGKEFSKHEIINKVLHCKSYFCKPYHSWEKGTVENINGLIRRFFPKGTDFDNISEEEIKRVENWINNRPMKVLNYMTPNEKYLKLTKLS